MTIIFLSLFVSQLQLTLTYIAFLIFLRVAVIITFEAEKYDVESLREAHHENCEYSSESRQVLHHHPVDHRHHGPDLWVGNELKKHH